MLRMRCDIIIVIIIIVMIFEASILTTGRVNQAPFFVIVLIFFLDAEEAYTTSIMIVGDAQDASR